MAGKEPYVEPVKHKVFNLPLNSQLGLLVYCVQAANDAMDNEKPHKAALYMRHARDIINNSGDMWPMEYVDEDFKNGFVWLEPKSL